MEFAVASPHASASIATFSAAPATSPAAHDFQVNEARPAAGLHAPLARPAATLIADEPRHLVPSRALATAATVSTVPDIRIGTIALEIRAAPPAPIAPAVAAAPPAPLPAAPSFSMRRHYLRGS